jgi:DNA recombination protein RmuC
MHERVSTWAKHLSDLGTALGRSTEAYNKAVGSLEARVLPSVRKFRELGAAGGEEIAEAKKVDETPRKLSLLD